MGLLDFFLPEGDSQQNQGAVDAYGAYAPASPISITSSGKGTNITPTVNNVDTSNIDLGIGGNEGFVLSNSNVSGGITTTDFGAIERSFDAIEGATGGAFNFADTQTGRAFDAVQGAVGGAFNFADAQTGRAIDAIQGATAGAFNFADRIVSNYEGLIGEYGDLVSYNNQQWTAQFENVQENFAGVVGGLGNTVTNLIGRISTDSERALTYVTQSNAGLQKATVDAINTVALRNQSSEAQGFDKLQDTLIKLGAGVAVTLLIAAYVLRK